MELQPPDATIKAMAGISVEITRANRYPLLDDYAAAKAKLQRGEVCPPEQSCISCEDIPLEERLCVKFVTRAGLHDPSESQV